MILINLLYRRFDNLLRTISEIVTCGIVLAIREREKQDKADWFRPEINNDKVAGTARSTNHSSYPAAGNSVSKKDLANQVPYPLRLALFPVGLTHNF